MIDWIMFQGISLNSRHPFNERTSPFLQFPIKPEAQGCLSHSKIVYCRELLLCSSGGCGLHVANDYTQLLIPLVLALRNFNSVCVCVCVH